MRFCFHRAVLIRLDVRQVFASVFHSWRFSSSWDDLAAVMAFVLVGVSFTVRRSACHVASAFWAFHIVPELRPNHFMERKWRAISLVNPVVSCPPLRSWRRYTTKRHTTHRATMCQTLSTTMMLHGDIGGSANFGWRFILVIQ